MVHVLTHRHELRGWTWRKSTVPHDSMQAMVAQLLSEMKFQGKCGAAILCPVIQTLACWSASVVTTQTSQGGSAVACACLPCSAIAVGYPRVLQLCRSHCVITLPLWFQCLKSLVSFIEMASVFLLIFNKISFYMCVLHVCGSVCVQTPPEEGVRSPRAGVNRWL